MKYPKKRMKINELLAFGWTKCELMDIYRSRSINRQFAIAGKKNPNKINSPIVFDTDALEKYERSKCTGV